MIDPKDWRVPLHKQSALKVYCCKECRFVCPEIDRLKAKLSEARGKALEEAAKIVDEKGCGEYCCSDPAFKLSDKIRALAKEI